MLIGLSMSNCIRDIIAGAIDIDDVWYIIAGTAIETELHLSQAINHCQEKYWQNDPAHGASIFYHLWTEGRILQPRVNGGPIPNIAAGHWLEVEQIQGPSARSDGDWDWIYPA